MKTRGGRTRLTLLKELLEGALDDDPAKSDRRSRIIS